MKAHKKLLQKFPSVFCSAAYIREYPFEERGGISHLLLNSGGGTFCFTVGNFDSKSSSHSHQKKKNYDKIFLFSIFISIKNHNKIQKQQQKAKQQNSKQLQNSNQQENCLGILIPTFCKSTTMTSSFMICGKLRYAKVMFSLFSKCSTVMVRTQDVLAAYKKKQTNRKEKQPREIFKRS